MKKSKNVSETVGDIAELWPLLENFEEGNLIVLSTIGVRLQSIAETHKDDLLGKISEIILPFFNNLVVLKSQKEFITEIERLLRASQKNSINPEDAAAILSKFFPTSEKEAEEDEKDAELIVTPEWFEGLIEDVEMLRKFVSEIHEHLENVQIALLELEYDPNNQENINTIFRGFHTIKSSSAFLGVKNLEETAHYIENMLALVRDGEIPVSSELVDIVFYSIGFVKDMAAVFDGADYDRERIIKSFLGIDIRPIVRVIRKITAERRTKKIGEILSDLGKIDDGKIREILSRQKTEDRRFGEIAMEEEDLAEEDIERAVRVQTAQKNRFSYVKVASARLNDLVDMVGELVVNQSMIREEVLSGIQVQERELHQLNQITTNIKNIVLSMGMVPIAEVFNKLRVVIRNASRDTGKMVETTITGEDTELDRNLIEAIHDPLVHIVRNAVDHGLEGTEEREVSGKNPVGRIEITAEHKGNGIEVTVSDDGKGIDRREIVKKAIEKKLVKKEDEARYLADEKLCYELMFNPGFSTAKKVTELSGRGVGLDVVKMNLEKIHGKVEVRSKEKEGTSFRIRLPLTLAIIDGFVTRVGEERYIFSFNLIKGIVVPNGENVRRMEDGEVILYDRERHIPVIFTEELVGGRMAEKKAGEYVILLISYEDSLYGIAVDEVIGKQEIVIKSLNEVLREMNLFSGGTIFGDGTIGFVVDIDEFIKKAQSSQ